LISVDHGHNLQELSLTFSSTVQYNEGIYSLKGSFFCCKKMQPQSQPTTCSLIQRKRAEHLTHI